MIYAFRATLQRAAARDEVIASLDQLIILRGNIGTRSQTRTDCTIRYLNGERSLHVAVRDGEQGSIGFARQIQNDTDDQDLTIPIEIPPLQSTTRFATWVDLRQAVWNARSVWAVTLRGLNAQLLAVPAADTARATILAYITFAQNDNDAESLAIENAFEDVLTSVPTTLTMLSDAVVDGYRTTLATATTDTLKTYLTQLDQSVVGCQRQIAAQTCLRGLHSTKVANMPGPATAASAMRVTELDAALTQSQSKLQDVNAFIDTVDDRLSAHPDTQDRERQRRLAGNLKQGWYHVKNLYKGEDSKIDLWVKVDEHNTVIDVSYLCAYRTDQN